MRKLLFLFLIVFITQFCFAQIDGKYMYEMSEDIYVYGSLEIKSLNVDEFKFSIYVNTKKLRLLRCDLNISKSQLSKELGFSSASSYGNLEDGRIEPTITKMTDIARFFNVPISEIFNFDKDVKL